MVANTPFPLASLLRRSLLVAAMCVSLMAAMMLSASGASARMRACFHLDPSVVSLTHSQLEHAGACLTRRERGRHLPVVRLLGGKS